MSSFLHSPDSADTATAVPSSPQSPSPPVATPTSALSSPPASLESMDANQLYGAGLEQYSACNYADALKCFEHCSALVAALSLFSSNEEITDIQTSYLKFLLVPFYVARCTASLRAESQTARLRNVQKAVAADLLFLDSCLLQGRNSSKGCRSSPSGAASEDEGKKSGGLPYDEDSSNVFLSTSDEAIVRSLLKEGGSSSSSFSTSSPFLSSPQSPSSARGSMPLPPGVSPSQMSSRDAKIARFKNSQRLKSLTSQKRSSLQQRRRLNIPSVDDFEGSDLESLERSLALCEVAEAAASSIDEVTTSRLELEMLAMSVERSSGLAASADGRGRGSQEEDERVRRREREKERPIELTRITKDPTTAKLVIKKEEVLNGVFRPGWNLPTMSLEEFAEKEYEEAIERQARQQLSEQQQKEAPRRFEYLKRDGLEDNLALVDASAKLDRDWDDWKDENPRGWGNKKGELGDKNF